MSNITFRTQLLGVLTDFCSATALPFATPELIAELVVRLARYQEEGVRLAPIVYLTNEMDLIENMLPESEKLQIGTATPDLQGIEAMLKICAPLATGDWRIYGHVFNGDLSYGVFRGSSNPISVDIDTVIMSPHETTVVIKAHQVAEECVELFSSKGPRHHIFFNHKKDSSPPPLEFFESLIQSITFKVKEKQKDPVKGYLTRVLLGAMQNSHGCMIAVTNMKTVPKFLNNDGVQLADPIDFPGMIRDLQASNIPSAVLERKAELVSGMIGSDGITLFDERGRLLGYRFFVRSSPTTGVIGGARRRAFATVCRHLGRGLSAAFMQSQDGWTKFESKNND